MDLVVNSLLTNGRGGVTIPLMPGRRFSFERSWPFADPPDAVWAALERTEAYPDWWPWLRAFDSVALAPGSRASFAVDPPLPYSVHLTVTLEQVVPAELVVARVEGDAEGLAHLRISEAGTGSELVLSWALEVRRPLLRLLATAARPVLEWGHRWVVDTGADQFRRRALSSDPVSPAVSPRSRDWRDGLVAGAAAGLLSGVPSTAHALVTGGDVLEATRAAGALLGRPGILRGMAAHVALSAGWGVVLSRTLPPAHPIAAGVAAGGAIAALDLGVVGRRFPAIRRLPPGPQVADHLAFGLVSGAVLRWRRVGRQRLGPRSS